MSNVAVIEEEKQRRGQAFQQAMQILERRYNCTVTIVPKWELGVSGTFVLGFDKQVLVGPAPADWVEDVGDNRRDGPAQSCAAE